MKNREDKYDQTMSCMFVKNSNTVSMSISRIILFT